MSPFSNETMDLNHVNNNNNNADSTGKVLKSDTGMMPSHGGDHHVKGEPPHGSTSSSIGAEIILSSEKSLGVRFANVSIREFDVVVGDHPDCLDGPPLAIGWNYVDKSPIRIDEYEHDKRHSSQSQSGGGIRNNTRTRTAKLPFGKQQTRRTHSSSSSSGLCRLSPIERNKRLRREFNVSEEEIMNAMNEIQRIQKNRSETKYEMEKLATRQVFVIDTCLRTLLILCVMYLFF